MTTLSGLAANAFSVKPDSREAATRVGKPQPIAMAARAPTVGLCRLWATALAGL